jgi:hypothetical protein
VWKILFGLAIWYVFVVVDSDVEVGSIGDEGEVLPGVQAGQRRMFICS